MTSSKGIVTALALLVVIVGGSWFIGTQLGLIGDSGTQGPPGVAPLTVQPTGACANRRVTLRLYLFDLFTKGALTTNAQVHIIKPGSVVGGMFESEDTWDTVTVDGSNDDDSTREYIPGEKLFMFTEITNYYQGLYEYNVPCPDTETNIVDVSMSALDISASDTDLVTTAGSGVISATANYDVSDDSATNTWTYAVSSGEADSAIAWNYWEIEKASGKRPEYHSVFVVRCNASTLAVDSYYDKTYYDGTYWYWLVDLDTYSDKSITTAMARGNPNLKYIDGFALAYDRTAESNDGTFLFKIQLSSLTADTEVLLGIDYLLDMSTFGDIAPVSDVSEAIDVQA